MKRTKNGKVKVSEEEMVEILLDASKALEDLPIGTVLIASLYGAAIMARMFGKKEDK